MKFDENLIRFLKTNTTLEYITSFYGTSITPDDVDDFREYSKVALHYDGGLPPSKIAKLMGISKRKIEHWIYEGNKPFIIKLLEHYLALGKPKNGSRWVSINSTRGGLLTGPWVEVPDKIKGYDDIRKVIEQLKKLPEFAEKNKFFRIGPDKKGIAFAYLLGMLVGDSSKTGIKRKQRMTRRIQIRLSKRYKTNERLGEFTSLCANCLDLRMGRRKDCPAGKMNTHPFYSWASQSSQLIQWIFNACLGLNDNEKTTYDPIKADWILDASKEFRISFLQGLADSDGFVDFSSQQAGVITEPNTELVQKVLLSLNVKTTPRLFTVNKLWSLMMSLRDAYRLPLFNPIVKSYRYKDVEKLFKAKRISGHWPLWLKEKIKQNIKEGLRGTEIVKKILNEEGIAIRTKNIRRMVKISET